MNVQIQINNSPNPNARFVTWAPSPCRIRITDPTGAASPIVNIQISATSVAGGGAVRFRRTAAGAFSNSITVPVPITGASVPFFVAGRFGQPSVNNSDVTIRARVGTTVVGSIQVMVRIRKNAVSLTASERNRLVSALAILNNQGLGRFTDFRDMHRSTLALNQAHGAPGFLPWHRAYLLDLERELQAIDPSVTLPYWRFDQAAPIIFTPDFLGGFDGSNNVQFSATNPLRFWRTDGVTGILRRPRADFNLNLAPPNILDETGTLGISTQYGSFRDDMEDNPHGRAHTRFIAPSLISDAATAPRDPLFFLLHCNVDRLWAKWQRLNNRFNPATPASYDGTASPLGHNLLDTMWPWNGVTGGTRPPTAPGGTLAISSVTAAPGLSPRVRDMLDYQGVVNPASQMGVGYDDIPFA